MREWTLMWKSTPDFEEQGGGEDKCIVCIVAFSGTGGSHRDWRCPQNSLLRAKVRRGRYR
jgi:hypothetical protein